ncbi:class I SAM-dependent methyltransferase [Kribbella sp. ALI-6-A]|uniref:class I SAM-dependent methyltransferase n=1 Tax=Kribbella sp. ALI-6-A TaxID=1933817 RepID=UPI000A001E6F|nr:class I SAM-dependent methyltransferase [Kribbella sp. ALI-6-A]
MSDDPLAQTPQSGEPDGTYVSNYFETRLAHNANRTKIWQHLCNYLQRWISTDAEVLELGAGWCDFSNNVKAKRVVAMDLDSTVDRAAAAHVEPVIGDCTDLGKFEDGTFDVVFASNLLEHLDRDSSNRLLAEAKRVLRPGGRLILMQPNFRLNPGRYFDDFTHVAIFTDQSLQDYLVAEGWKIDAVKAKFMPLTLKSKGGNLTFVVPWYLRSPIKPLAGQMLVVASR